jgi:hypothetical protein
LSEALASWRKPMAVHVPAKVVMDLAVALALGGDCLADVAVLRADVRVLHGPVASDPTVSRTIDALALDAPRALSAIGAARAAARSRVWSLAGSSATDHRSTAEQPVVVEVDATLGTAHSDKGAGPAHVQARVWPSSAVGVLAPGPRGPVSRSRCGCARATPGPTPPPTTSPESVTRCASFPALPPGPGRAGGCWCASTGPGPPTIC